MKPIKNLTLGMVALCASHALAADIHYRVQSGDTFQSLAAHFHVAEKSILHANELTLEHHLRPGHYLMIPSASEKHDARSSARVPETGHKNRKTVYFVRNGDQDWAIARRSHLTVAQLHDLNPGVLWNPLKIGTRITVPFVSAHGSLIAKSAPAGRAWKAHWHVIAKGETIQSIAKKGRVTVALLKKMNPEADLAALRHGGKVRVPGVFVHGKLVFDRDIKHFPIASKIPAAHLTAFAKQKSWKAHWHLVEGGESDWIIAHRAGIKVPLLREMNPGVDLTALHAGEKIRVPGVVAMLGGRAVHKIYSSHVAVTGDHVTVRRAGGMNAGRVCMVDAGNQASVLQRDGNWYEVRFGGGTVGWIRGDHLVPIHVRVDVVAQTKRRRQDRERAERARYDAYLDQKRREQIEETREEARAQSHHGSSHDQRVAVQESLHHQHFLAHEKREAEHEQKVARNERAHEKVAQAKPHYVATRAHHKSEEHYASSQLMAMDKNADSDDDSDADAEKVISSARKMVGVRYVWGGTNPSRGVDCSAFAKIAYGRNGINLPRTSIEQSSRGERVAYRDLRKGDLVFFHTYGRGNRVTHVGIYEGAGRFLEASSRQHRVTESSLEDAYHRRHLVGARRLLARKHHRKTAVAEEDSKPDSTSASKSDDKPDLSASGSDAPPPLDTPQSPR